MLVRPVPNTSHANPSRGAQLFQRAVIVFEGTPADLKANQTVRKEWLEV